MICVFMSLFSEQVFEHFSKYGKVERVYVFVVCICLVLIRDGNKYSSNPSTQLHQNIGYINQFLSVDLLQSVFFTGFSCYELAIYSQIRNMSYVFQIFAFLYKKNKLKNSIM